MGFFKDSNFSSLTFYVSPVAYLLNIQKFFNKQPLKYMHNLSFQKYNRNVIGQKSVMEHESEKKVT
jgi:hypothetical protein